MATVGLFFIDTANYTPWNVSGEGAIGAIGGGMAIALFSYLGVETASVAAAKVKDPDRNMPRGDDPRHGGDRRRLHALAHRRLRDPLDDTLAELERPVLGAANVMFGGTWAGNVMSSS